MNYEKAIAVVMQPTRWLSEIGLRQLWSDNLQDLNLSAEHLAVLERHLLRAGMAVQAEFLTHIPSFLDVLSDLDIYTDHYSNARAPTHLKPRMGLGASLSAAGVLQIAWLPHEEDFVGESRPIRGQDLDEVNLIIELELDSPDLAFPPDISPQAESGYLRELNCALVQGLSALIRAAMAVADVELENWIDVDPLTGAMCITTPEMRVEMLATQGRELCLLELAAQQAELNRLLAAAGHSDLEAYRSAQRAAGPVRIVATMANTELDVQVQVVLRIEQQLQSFTQTLIDAEEAVDD